MAHDVTLTRRPSDGRYDLTRGADGDLAGDDTAGFAVVSQLGDQRGSPGVPGWAFDEIGDVGSQLHLVQTDTPANRSQALAYASEALAPLVAEREIELPATPAPSLQPSPAGRIDLYEPYTTPDGKQQSARVPLVI